MFKPKSYKQVNILLALFSIFISGTLFLVLYFKITPNELKPVSKTGYTILPNYQIFTHDFDHDGYSETLKFNLYETSNRYNYNVYQNNGKLIDQFNFDGKTKYSWGNFFDFNKDGSDEIFQFSRIEDTLFLYVVDVKAKKNIVEKQAVLFAPQNYPYSSWDIIQAKPLRLANFDKDDTDDELLLMVMTGYALEPRALYIYDIEKNKILRKFDTAAGLREPFFFDLTGDGEDEIIVATTASDNVDDDRPYHDRTSWLFVLNRQLQPVIKPKNYGGYPGSVNAIPFNYNNSPSLIISHRTSGNNKNPVTLTVMDKAGKILQKKKILRHGYYSLFINPDDHVAPLYVAIDDYGIMRLKNDLTVFSEIEITNKSYSQKFIDLDADGQKELLFLTQNGIIIFDANLNILAKNEYKRATQYLFTKQNGFNKPLQLSVIIDGAQILYDFKPNRFYHYFFPGFILLSILLFLILVQNHKWVSQIYRYIGVVQSILRNNNNGLFLIDQNNRLVTYNSSLSRILKLATPIHKKQYFNEAFAGTPFLVQFIEQAINKEIAISRRFVFEEKELNLKASPLSLFGSLTYGWFIEIHNVSDVVHNERLKGWSKTAQKLAHDIKTPLSSIALNISNLQSRLDKHNLADSDDINDDLDIMREEIDRVRDMTRNFLKFVNLEKPNKESVNLAQLINESLDSFKSFINEQTDLILDIPKGIPDVWLDPVQIKMVLQILIENAIDAIKGNGKIQVSVALAQNLYPLAPMLEIEVADNGPGIDKAMQPEIFDPYYTTKRDGTGMGLAIARKIIEDHNGKISVYSKNGLGTTFNISIPIN